MSSASRIAVVLVLCALAIVACQPVLPLTPTPATPAEPAKPVDAAGAQALLKEGIAYNEEGDYEQAIETLTEAIALDPGLAEAYFFRGLAYGNHGDMNSAVEDLDKAILLDPENIDAHNVRGTAYFILGDYAAAVQDCAVALDLARPYLGPAVPSLSVLGAIAEMTRTEPETLLESFDEAIRQDPTAAEAYLLRGFARWHLGDVEGAVEDFERAESMTYILGVLPPLWSASFGDFPDSAAAVADFELAWALADPDSFIAGMIEGTLEDLRVAE